MMVYRLYLFSLKKIKAAAVSAYSYLDNIGEPCKKKNIVLYMLNVIEDIAKAADNDLSEINNKLWELSRTTK